MFGFVLIPRPTTLSRHHTCRFGLGAGTAGGMKKMMGYIGEYANERTQFGKPLKDFGLIQKKFSEIAVRAYAMESMAYLTTALIDTTKMDCAVRI